MQHQNIESLETMYHSSVNNRVNKQADYTIYENTHVPKMYDHNFIYIHKQLDKIQFESIYNKHKYDNKRQGKAYVNFYFPVNLSVDRSVYNSRVEYEDYESETIIFMELIQTLDKWKRYDDVEVVKVNTNDQLNEFLQINFIEDSGISKRFAHDKKQFNKHLYESGILDFYIAYYKGTPAASGEMYTNKGIGKLENLFVEETLRNKGIGTELMKQMVEQSELDNVTDFYLATYEYDDPIKLYKKLGFIEVAKQRVLTVFYS